MALARPSLINCAALVMAAIVPAASCSDGRPGLPSTGWSRGTTGRAPEKTLPASSGSTVQTGTDRPMALAHRCKCPGSANTKKGAVASLRCNQARNVISGPIPDGSPCVRARGRQETCGVPVMFAHTLPAPCFCRSYTCRCCLSFADDDGLLAQLLVTPVRMHLEFLFQHFVANILSGCDASASV